MVLTQPWRRKKKLLVGLRGTEEGDRMKGREKEASGKTARKDFVLSKPPVAVK